MERFLRNKTFAVFLTMVFAFCSFDIVCFDVAAKQSLDYFYESFEEYTESDIGLSWIATGGVVANEPLGVRGRALKLISEKNIDATVYKEFSAPISEADFVIEFWIKMNCGFDLAAITTDGGALNIVGFRTNYGKLGLYKTGNGRMSFAPDNVDASLKYNLDTWNRIRIEVNKTDKIYRIFSPYAEFEAEYTANFGDISGMRFTAIGQSGAESIIFLDQLSIREPKAQTNIATIENINGELVCENAGAVTGDIAMRSNGDIIFNCGTEVREDGELTYDVDLNKGTMHIDLDNHFPESGGERSIIAVEITHRDALYPWMYLKYATKDGMKTAGYFSGKNTREDVTETFFLPDADFNNSKCQYDLTLVSYDGLTENQTGLSNRQKFSQNWVYVKNIRVYKTNQKSPYEVDITTENIGNIFYDAQTPKFDITYNLLADESVDLFAEYAVYEYDDNSEKVLLYTKETKEIVSDKYTQCAVLPVSKYGLYEFEVRLTDSEGNIYQSMSVPFSKCVKNDGLNYSLGASGHLTRYGDAEAEIELLKNAGLGLYRDDFGWINYERQEGVYRLGKRETKLLELTKENNIKLLPILTGNNTNYCPEHENSYSLVKSNLMPFATFISKIVQEDLFSHIEMVEIWSEPDLLKIIDGIKNDSLEERARVYAKDVEYAYNAIKSVRPDIEVGAFSMSGGLHENYRKGFVDYVLDEMGNSKAFDNMTLHPYMSGEDPEIGTFGADNEDANSSVAYRINYYRDLMNGKTIGVETGNLYSQNNTASMWHTEFGWSTAKHSDALANKSECEQASLIIRAYDAIKQNNFDDKAWIYELADSGEGMYEKEYNFGIIHSRNSKVPYSAKFAYLAVSNYNRLTSGAEAVTQGEISQYVFRSKYDCGERDVYMVWTTGGDRNVKMRFADDAAYYDFYGNRISKDELVTDGWFKITTKPFYVIEGAELDTDCQVSAYFSKNGIIMAEPKLSDIDVSGFDITIDFNNMESDTEYTVVTAVYNDGIMLDAVIISDEQKKENGAICELKNNSFKNCFRGYDEIKLIVLKNTDTLSPIGECVSVK